MSVALYRDRIARLPKLAECVGLYPLREGSGATSWDLTLGRHHLTLVNSPTWQTGGGLTLNGSNQYAYAANHADHNFGTGDFVIEAVCSLSSISGYRVIASTYQGSTAGWTFQIASSAIELSIAGDAGTLLNCSTPVSTGVKYHMLVQRVAGQMQGFLNGAADGTATNAASISSTQIMAVGRLASLGLSHLAGTIYGVNIIKGASWTPAQIAARARLAGV